MRTPHFPRHRWISVVIVCLVFGLVALYLSPLLSALASKDSYTRFIGFLSNNERGGAAFGRTLIFASVVSSLEVLLGFGGALVLRSVQVFTTTGRTLSLLLAPALFGNLSIAFLFKIQLMNADWFERAVASRSFASVWGSFLVIEVWQYGSLFLYLFWLRLQRLPTNALDFTRVTRLNRAEVVRDVLWPHCRNLAGLLLLVGFLFACQEFAKTELIFKPSLGTDTELANHWLEREYYRDLNTYDANFARNSTFKNSAGFLVATLILAASVILLMLSAISRAVRWIPILSIPSRREEGAKDRTETSAVSRILAWFITLLVLLPLVGAIRYLRPGIVSDLNEISQALLLAIAGAFIASLIAISFSVAARLAGLRLLQKFDGKSLRVFIALFVLQAVPAICIGLCGYEWISLLSRYSTPQQLSIWIVGQSILALPMLGGFLLWIHFQITTKELEFQQASQLSLRETTKWTFLKRFKLEYILVFIFAFSFIWNEDTLNRIMSDAIPSIVHRLGARITGRGTSYSEAATLVIFSVTLSLIMVLAWNTLLSRALRREDAR